ncbi:hypothetical protein [Streptosporangium sp. NPDC002607]
MAVVLLLLVGCSEPADTGKTATPAGAARTGGTTAPAGDLGLTQSDAPQAMPDGVVIRFLSCGPETCGGGERMNVGADGRAVSLRKGELAVIRLSPAELSELRDGLVALLAGREGTIERTRASDQPFFDVTVVGLDGKVHQTRLEGAPLVEDKPIVAAFDRLSVLTRRVRATGELDRTAPIQVRMYEDENTDPVRRATWPKGVPMPVVPTSAPASWIENRVYRGQEAKALRAALGAARDYVEVRVGKRRLIVFWEAEVPWGE